MPMAELPNTEFKAMLDLREKKDQLRLVAEVVAMANAEGGVIRIGVDDDGNAVGVDARTAATFDPANVANLVDSFLGTDHVEVTVHRRHLNSEHLIVDLVIEKFPTPPLVICKEGNHQSEKGQKSEFRKGDVLVRRGTRASRATRSDYLAWTEAACDSARRLLMDRVSFVSTLPPEAELSVAIGEVDLTEPAAMLSHACRAWTAEPTRLLGPSELAWLLVGEGELGDLGDVAARLLFQSALRKNATLYHWLARIQPTAEWIERSVHEAMTARDRDRTDAGRAIVAVSALTLDSDAYGRVIAELSASRYKHFREAGAAVRQQDEIDRLRETVRSPMNGEALASLSDGELTARSTAEAQQLLDGSNLAVSRRLIRLGLERFSRTAAGGRLAYDRG
jgi:hypothetical protein